MYDPDLHLFGSDDEIVIRERLYRMTQTVRKETAGPVLAANGEDEGTAIGWSTVVYDREACEFKVWYVPHQDTRIRLAVSKDCLQWSRRGMAVPDGPVRKCDALGLVDVGRSVDRWFGDARLLGFCYLAGADPGWGDAGLHSVKSVDGERLEINPSGIIPGAGDRSSMFYDDVLDEYWLISRRHRLGFPGMRLEEISRGRTANLWKSRNLVDWEDFGTIISYDDADDPDVQIYGMQPFRCGRGFAALVEMYHLNIERLDTQLAYSEDGIKWHRTDGRTPVIPLGGEGAWDSHWTVPTINSPIPWGDRLLVPYIGAGTKHGSGIRHRRGVGLASIRKDGWISLEAGRVEGKLVTKKLPLDKPMRLEVNADVHSGFLAVDVISTVPGKVFDPVPGYEAEKSRIENTDSVCHRVTWADKEVVRPIDGEACYLRFTMYQGSLFSYRWSEAGT